eukprot:s3631_g1.t1
MTYEIQCALHRCTLAQAATWRMSFAPENTGCLVTLPPELKTGGPERMLQLKQMPSPPWRCNAFAATIFLANLVLPVMTLEEVGSSLWVASTSSVVSLMGAPPFASANELKSLFSKAVQVVLKELSQRASLPPPPPGPPPPPAFPPPPAPPRP